jgi:superfamily II DNA/RNA helicase
VDDGYILPPLNMVTDFVEVDERGTGEDLFKHVTLSATTMHREMRETSEHRARRVAELVNSNDESWIVWCNTNDEADKLAEYIPEALEVRGSESPAQD